MARPDRGAFVRANWRWLVVVGVAFLVWGYVSDNIIAAAAGVAMLGWIGWHMLIKRG